MKNLTPETRLKIYQAQNNQAGVKAMLEIIRDLGGMSTIERMVNNYERSERLEAKHGCK